MQEDIIRQWAETNSITLTNAQLKTLADYQALVLETNAHTNLTSITDPQDFAVKHFIDSMTLLPYITEAAPTLVDIGTGAGFPGLVLRIIREDLRLTLLDSLGKRITFLRNTADKLGLSGIEFIHARAEELGRIGVEYDICTARAVAAMDRLIPWALPLVRPGGLFLAMKGPDVTEELEKAKPALTKYGGIVDKVDVVEIAPGLKHSIIVVVRK